MHDDGWLRCEEMSGAVADAARQLEIDCDGLDDLLVLRLIVEMAGDYVELSGGREEGDES